MVHHTLTSKFKCWNVTIVEQDQAQFKRRILAYYSILCPLCLVEVVKWEYSWNGRSVIVIEEDFWIGRVIALCTNALLVICVFSGFVEVLW